MSLPEPPDELQTTKLARIEEVDRYADYLADFESEAAFEMGWQEYAYKRIREIDAEDDQTRRNLIGEQPGDSNSPRGATEPLSNQVMPEAPASGKEER